MLVDVALPLPLFRTFTYAVEGRGEPLDPGMRVLVPFRNRKEIGIVVGAGSAREGITPKPIVAIPDDAPVLDPAMLSLCRWIAQYYIVPLGVEGGRVGFLPFQHVLLRRFFAGRKTYRIDRRGICRAAEYSAGNESA